MGFLAAARRSIRPKSGTQPLWEANLCKSTPGIRQIDFRVEAGGVTAVFSCGPGKLTIEFVVNEYLPSPLLMNINGNEHEDY